MLAEICTPTYIVDDNVAACCTCVCVCVCAWKDARMPTGLAKTPCKASCRGVENKASRPSPSPPPDRFKK